MSLRVRMLKYFPMTGHGTNDYALRITHYIIELL